VASARPAGSQGTRLIGLHGVKRAGKDTAGQFIQEWAHERGLSHCKQGWADAMKLSIGRLFGVPDEHAIDFCDNLKTFGKIRVYVEGPGMGDIGNIHALTVDGREFLKRYGTESHREVFGQDFWLDQLLPFHDWPRLWGHASICIVSDCRFVNEINRIHDLGGQVWLIDRDTGDQDDHISEQIHRHLCDQEIKNNGTLDDLRSAVRELLSPTLS
jgi:hypothetical protein